MWNNQTISVVLPTYNEKDSIYEIIQGFFATNLVDEVIVVNNNAAAGTSEEVAKTKALEVFEKKQGYGYSIRKGLETATSDYVVICEPDATFVPNDIIKLLAYALECDIVYGTRTITTFIWSGANMGRFLRYGNWAVAKMMEVLFNTISLSDVGCTMRLLNRHAIDVLKDKYKVGGSYFGVEMMLLSMVNKLRILQIPVNYKDRVGKSSVTGDFYKAFKLGMQMIFYIVWFRMKSILPKR